MEVVVMMVLLILVTVGLMITLGMIAWSGPDDAASQGNDKAARERPADGDSPAVPTTLEGVLVAQLVAGTISPAQYRKAVTRIAERDEERNPLSVPEGDRPETGA